MTRASCKRLLTCIHRLIVSGALTATLLLSVQSMQAQELSPAQQRGKALTDEGLTQLEAKQYDAALNRFLEADKLLQTPRSALRVAVALEGLGRFKEAAEWASKVAPRADAQNDTDQPPRDEAREVIERAAASQSPLTIKLPPNTPGQVRLDGIVLPVANGVAQTRVYPGTHEIAFDAEGGTRVETVTAIKGQPLELQLTGAAGTAKTNVPQQARSSGLPLWPFLVGGGGLILGGVATGLAISAASTQSDFYDLCPETDGVPYCPTTTDVDNAAELRQDIMTRNGAAIGLGIGGAALLGVAIVGLVVGIPSQEVAVSPWLNPYQGGLTATGRF